MYAAAIHRWREVMGWGGALVGRQLGGDGGIGRGRALAHRFASWARRCVRWRRSRPAWWPESGSVEQFLAVHVPCVLVKPDALLLRIEGDGPGSWFVHGICGGCGVTAGLTLSKRSDPVAEDERLYDYIGFWFDDLLTLPSGEPDMPRFIDLRDRLQGSVLAAFAEYVARRGERQPAR